MMCWLPQVVTTMMAIATALSIVFAIDQIGIRIIVGGVGLVGVWYVGFKVPTRERVLSQRLEGDQ